MRSRAAVSTSRGTTGPLEVITGSREASPTLDEQREPLVDRPRQREPPAHVAHAGDRSRQGGGLGVQRVHRRLTPDRLGEVPVHHAAAGRDLAELAVLEHHRRQRELVQDRVDRVRHAERSPVGGPIDRAVDQVDRVHAVEAVRAARGQDVGEPRRRTDAEHGRQTRLAEPVVQLELRRVTWNRPPRSA